MELKPCPWCSSTNVKQFTAGGDAYVQCLECTACGPDHKNGRHWNDAPRPPAPRRVVPQGFCELCGEPMPPGETMFKFHGYSGPCPTRAASTADAIKP